jgi:hypothetical protein
MQVQSKEFILTQIGHLKPIKYNKFQWWRNYQSPQPLSEYRPMLDRIINGDYDTSPYYWMAQLAIHEMKEKMDAVACPEKKRDIQSLYMEKYRRLIQDYEKDEAQRLINLRKGFAKYFRISQEEVIELMDNFDGNLEELHNHIEQISNTKLAA